MLLFGHIGITLGIAQVVEAKLGIRMNYRLIIIASLLPDIIDKPVGMILLPLENGRVFGHTLLFLIILLMAGMAGSKYRKFLFLTFASSLHLIEDEMWKEPVTLLWPLLGGFPPKEFRTFTEYLGTILSGYIPSFSHTFLSEVIGLIILLSFVWRNYLRKDMIFADEQQIL